ncbi:hypothetical protein FB192DRAFT_1404525, partial [Mucor lusitanicus]
MDNQFASFTLIHHLQETNNMPVAGYVNFTEKYKLIQTQNFLPGFRFKQILSELDKLSFRDDRDKIKALLAELSSGQDEAAMLKVFNKNLRFPEGVIYYTLSDFFRLKMTSLLHYALEYRPLPSNLVSTYIAAAQSDDASYQMALTLYSDTLFQLKSLFYSMGALGGYDRSRFEARFGLVWEDRPINSRI